MMHAQACALAGSMLLLWATTGRADAARAPQSRTPPVLDIREVQIVPGTISISAIVRIGVRNNSEVDRRVCIGAFHLTMRPVGDRYAEGGALDCQDRRQYLVIPAGAAHIFERSVLRREFGRDATLQIGMLLFQAPAAEAGPPETIDVAWDGRVVDAESAGRRAAR